MRHPISLHNTMPASGYCIPTLLNHKSSSEILRVSHFHGRIAHLFINRTFSSSRVPAFIGTSVLNRPSYRFRSMPSQVMEQMQSNVVVKDKKRGDGSSVGSKYGKLERMTIYLKILGLEKEIGGLKIIHVAGTKGKGSTCTFCEGFYGSVVFVRDFHFSS
ncbi:hypothetical protein M0R45_030658 [Rubus argutus]|uniref:Folylpolyglutamate synthase n=1 Tax=Rubus argutus TaxID=59490 RepID=A0AAW1WBN8_RUBAR